jgi:hypothetical protein
MASESDTSTPTGVATGRVGGAPAPGAGHARLGPIIGRWITEGHTVASAQAPSVEIVASDVYEWAPGGFFVLHQAHGRIGDVGVGGIEIIGYDAERDAFPVRFFDSQGNATRHLLTVEGSEWTWQGERTRCRSVLSADGRTMTAHHERSDDGVRWTPSMEVTLTRVG